MTRPNKALGMIFTLVNFSRGITREKVLSQAAMAVSLKQFRDRYPAATLLSELLMVQEEQFVVKVIIQTQAAGTSVGMAADTVLEVAEDRARQRALEGLSNWEAQQASSQIPELSLPTRSSDHNAHNYNTVDNVTIDNIVESAQSSLPATTESPHKQGKQDVPETDLPDARPRAQTQFLNQSVTSPQPAQKESTIVSVPTVDSSLENSAIALPLEEASFKPEDLLYDSLPPPVNLSDVIAQTDVELRRLGWSVTDGRDYLDKTYSKRSRHDLTDEELLAFLLHLESLPTPQSRE